VLSQRNKTVQIVIFYSAQGADTSFFQGGSTRANNCIQEESRMHCDQETKRPRSLDF